MFLLECIYQCAAGKCLYERVKLFPSLLHPPTRQFWRSNGRVATKMPSKFALDQFLDQDSSHHILVIFTLLEQSIQMCCNHVILLFGSPCFKLLTEYFEKYLTEVGGIYLAKYAESIGKKVISRSCLMMNKLQKYTLGKPKQNAATKTSLAVNSKVLRANKITIRCQQS